MEISSLDPHENNPTVVAITKNRSSAFAVRWAIDHLLVSKQTLVLVHVRTRHGLNGGTVEANGGSVEDLFAACRACYARKGVPKALVQEIVLDGTDVHTALLDYINHNNVTKFVLGASSRSVLTRFTHMVSDLQWLVTIGTETHRFRSSGASRPTGAEAVNVDGQSGHSRFWTPDVPALINKAAPDFCSVYVISKGKAQSIRPAARQSDSLALHKQPSPLPPVRFNRPELEDGIGSFSMRKIADDHHENPNRRFNNDLLDKVSKRRPRNLSRHGYVEFDSLGLGTNFQSMDITRVEGLDATNVGETADLALNHMSSSEILRLKQEVQQTMNMYNTACIEAVSAQKQIYELEHLKQAEVSRFEQARLAEEAALALIETEKAKCRAAIEAAEKAQKIAEKEIQRRKHAEMKAKREAEEKNRALNVLSNNDDRCRKYTLQELEAATNKFSSSMKIGEGGYGPVFKGKLDHTPVAIKVLRPDAAQGRKQFQQEVEVLTCMRHPNMVLLMGACPEYGCLVYEYMNNGSLEDRLFRKGNTPPIPWGVRFKLAADIATGLLFLHQAKPEPLVHRDLKPANILLDHHYTCKISDVGLARLVPPSVASSVTQYHMTSAAGTFCYIDPEYQQTGKLGTKSDIYSLGVILLQLITARPPMGLSHHVEKAIDKGTFADLLDPTVPDWPVEEALGFAKLALKCTELRKKDRPDLGDVILPELNRLKEYGMEHGLSQWHNSPITSPRISFS